MYARFLASFCLLFVAVAPGRAESAVPAQRQLEVHLKGDESSSPDVQWEMRRELASLMQQAGFRLVWRGSADPPSNGEASQLVMVELRGVCAAVPRARAGALPGSLVLASSAVADGKILPFTWVDCSALNRFLAPVMAEDTKARQAYLYGRSLARVLSHEFYHVLAQTGDHTVDGVAKARVSISDLLAETFSFEPVALERVRPPAPETSTDDAPASGR